MEFREPRPGEIIGQNYIIESELGRGGFGVVFRARHVDIDRVVALKVLLVTYAKKDPTAVERFRREATIAASLNYPNTVRVFDYGETNEGVFYIIMEFIQGKDLAHILKRNGRLGVRRGIHIIRQVLHAMMEAHSRGIVHRDIKPDNIMIVPLGYDPDFVKVMDFGIAKMAHGGQTLTQAGLTLGTPRYMPVEQLKGQPLTPATDLYATGLVLYEMLVGAPAFDAETAVDVAVSVMERPSLRVDPATGLPPAVRAIIEKACAKHAEDRYPSAREFLNAINQLDPELLDIDPREEQLDPRLDPPRGGGRQTVALPELDRPIPEGGDYEDAIRTVALRVAETTAKADQPRPIAPPKGDETINLHPEFHEARTMAMPVLDARLPDSTPTAAERAEAAQSSGTRMERARTEVPHVTSPVAIAVDRAEDGASRPAAGHRETGDGRLVVILQSVALVLLVAILLKLLL